MRLDQAAQALELLTSRLSAVAEAQHSISAQSASFSDRLSQLQDAVANARAAGMLSCVKCVYVCV